MANTNINIDSDLLNFYHQQAVEPLKKKVDSIDADTVGAIPVEQKAAKNGIASLDEQGKVPTTQLPEALYAFDVSSASISRPTSSTSTVDSVTYTKEIGLTKTTKTLTLKDKTTAKDTNVDVVTDVQLTLPKATNNKFGVTTFNNKTLTVDSHGVVTISDAVLDRITALEIALQVTPDGDEVEY